MRLCGCAVVRLQWACDQFLSDTLNSLCQKLLDWVAGKLGLCLQPENVCGGVGFCSGAGVKGECDKKEEKKGTYLHAPTDRPTPRTAPHHPPTRSAHVFACA